LTPERVLNLLCALSVWSWAPLGLLNDAAPGPVRVAVSALHVVVGWCFLTRQPLRFAGRPRHLVAATPAIVCGGFAFVLAQPFGEWPPALTALFVLGTARTAASLLYLGRSFAVLPAARGVVARGPYALLRHPAYAGEALMVVSSGLAASPRHPWAVLALLVFFAVALKLRIGAEEALLAGDPVYGDYARRVRWSLVPGVW